MSVEIAVATCTTGEQERIVRAVLEPVASGRARLRFSRSKDELRLLMPDCEVLFAGRADAGLVAAAPRLKWIHLDVAGVERSLSPELEASGILLTNSRGMHRAYMAEHVMALVLAFAKRLHVAMRSQVRRHWAYTEISEASFSVAGMTCGILGLGAVGLETARLAAAQGMRCAGTKRTIEGFEPPEWLERVTDEEGTDSVIRESDFLVVTLPLTPRTTMLLDGARLRSMKRGSYLINVARGRIVDEKALVELLREGHLGGAGLDVMETEPLPASSPLWELENVILTPHVSGNYPAYARDAAELFARNLRRYLDGQPLLNVVDQRLGY